MKTLVEPEAAVAVDKKPARRKKSPAEKPLSKQVDATRTKRAAKAPAPSAAPSLRFFHSEGLRTKTLDVLTTLEQAEDARQHRNALADVVLELTDSGMDYFYLRPLKLAKSGFFVEQSANLGMGATTRILGSVIRNIIGGMDSAQLRVVAGYIRQLMN